MNSLWKYALKLTENEYHNYPAWSYSLIAKYAREGFSSLQNLHTRIEPTASMNFGSLVDSILTKGMKATMDHYIVRNKPLPTPSKKAVLDMLYKKTLSPYNLIPQDIFENVMDECAYQTKWKFETRVKSLDDESDYYDAIFNHKEIISEEDWKDAVAMAKNILTDPYLKTIFGAPKCQGNIEYLYQIQFVKNMQIDPDKNVPVKIMLDLLKVDHKEKTLQPVDLKTSSNPAYSFPEQFVKMRYDIQASEYTDVLQEVISNTEYQDYTILPYLFTDVSRTDKIPVTYVYDPKSESQANGLTFGSEKTYQYRNWKSLLSEIIDYENSNAVVPSFIKTDGPNDLVELLNSHKF